MSTLPLTNSANNSYESDFKTANPLWWPPTLEGLDRDMHGVHFSFVSSPVRKIKEVYAHAVLPLEEMRKVISLSFVSSDEDLHLKMHKVPHPSRAFLKENSSDPAKCKTFGICGVKGFTIKEKEDARAFSELSKKVERVLVNLQLPELTNINSEHEVSYNGLIDGIGELCANTFPNMKPYESAFVVHRGAEHSYISKKTRNNESIFSP